jgi:hypothetical protein
MDPVIINSVLVCIQPEADIVAVKANVRGGDQGLQPRKN